MKKTFKYYLGVWILVFAIFNVAVFVSPSEMGEMNKFGGAFWAGYIFILLAFIGELAISYFAFQAKNLQKFFYQIPLIRISWIGLILIFIFGTATMAIPNLPNWLGIIVCFTVLGFNFISLLKARAAGELVSQLDDHLKIHTSFIKSLSANAAGLTSSAETSFAKKESKRVYEAIRYSDPMTNEHLLDIESKIQSKLEEFSDLILTDDVNAIKKQADDLISLIKNRNQQCKLMK